MAHSEKAYVIDNVGPGNCWLFGSNHVRHVNKKEIHNVIKVVPVKSLIYPIAIEIRCIARVFVIYIAAVLGKILAWLRKNVVLRSLDTMSRSNYKLVGDERSATNRG